VCAKKHFKSKHQRGASELPPINRYGVHKPSNLDYINQAPPIKHGSQRPKERAEEKAVQELEDYQGEPDQPSAHAELCIYIYTQSPLIWVLKGGSNLHVIALSYW